MDRRYRIIVLYQIALPMLALAMCVLWVSACQSRADAIDTRGYLRVDIDTSPLSLDPRYGTDAVSSRINELIFDSLARVDAQGNIKGDLATRIDQPTLTELVFHLRRGVRFSDGRPLTARDVKYTYESILDPASLSPKRGAMAELAAVEAPDDYTVRFVTRRPYAPALEWALLGVVPYGTAPQHADLNGPPGSGPFRLKRFVRDEWVIMDRNPYHPAARFGIAGVAFKIVPDPTVCALELIKGVAGFAENSLPPELVSYLRTRRGLRVIQTPGTTYQYLEFNFRDPILADVRVRRAIAMAIDRQAIVASIMRNTARVASGMLAPENWAYEPDVTRYPYDPQRARELLDAAGYPVRKDGTRFTLVYKTTQGEERRLLAEALAAMLAKVGIGLRIRSYEWATFYSDIQRGNFDLTSLAWVGINDPHHYYMVFDSRMTPPSGLNRGAYSNPAMDRLLEEGDAALDPARRKAIYARVQQLAAKDLPYIPLWWQDNVVVMDPVVTGFEPYPNGSLRSFARLEIAPVSAEASAR